MRSTASGTLEGCCCTKALETGRIGLDPGGYVPPSAGTDNHDHGHLSVLLASGQQIRADRKVPFDAHLPTILSPSGANAINLERPAGALPCETKSGEQLLRSVDLVTWPELLSHREARFVWRHRRETPSEDPLAARWHLADVNGRRSREFDHPRDLRNMILVVGLASNSAL